MHCTSGHILCSAHISETIPLEAVQALSFGTMESKRRPILLPLFIKFQLFLPVLVHESEEISLSHTLIGIVWLGVGLTRITLV